MLIVTSDLSSFPWIINKQRERERERLRETETQRE